MRGADGEDVLDAVGGAAEFPVGLVVVLPHLDGHLDGCGDSSMLVAAVAGVSGR